MSEVSPLSLIPRNTDRGSRGIRESMVIIGAKVILFSLVPEFARTSVLTLVSYQGLLMLVKFLASQQTQVLLSVWTESKNCHPWISLLCPDLLNHD